MDVELVGDTTYGKPVGFFDIDINKYEMFTPEFSVQNSANQGGYYAGFAPGGTGYPGFHDFDDLTKDFGDPTEGLLAHILNFVNTGTYAVTKQTVQSLNTRARAFLMARPGKSNGLMNKRKFIGMVHNKKLKLKQQRKNQVTPFK